MADWYSCVLGPRPIPLAGHPFHVWSRPNIVSLFKSSWPTARRYRSTKSTERILLSQSLQRPSEYFCCFFFGGGGNHVNSYLVDGHTLIGFRGHSHNYRLKRMANKKEFPLAFRHTTRVELISGVLHNCLLLINLSRVPKTSTFSDSLQSKWICCEIQLWKLKKNCWLLYSVNYATAITSKYLSDLLRQQFFCKSHEPNLT